MIVRAMAAFRGTPSAMMRTRMAAEGMPPHRYDFGMIRRYDICMAIKSEV